MKRANTLAMLIVAFLPAALGAQEPPSWNQWRGPNRNGLAPKSPALIDSLPQQGLAPKWLSEHVNSSFDGGWGSPVVADGKVYLYVHHKALKPGAKLPPRKYPWLEPNQRIVSGRPMTNKEWDEYEVHRRDEDETIARYYEFAEDLFCFDAAAGKTLWKNHKASVYTRFVQSGTPAVIGGRIYVLGAARTPRCIDARTGQTIWETRLPGPFRDDYAMSSFAVADGVAMVLAGHLVALDAATGKLLWEGDAKKTSGIHCSPVVWTAGGRELAIVNVGYTDTICVEPRTGKELWRIQSDANHSTPVVVGDRLITYGDSRRKGLRCYAISTKGAQELWIYNGLADSGSSPVVVGGYVYVQGGPNLACVDMTDGSQKWMTLLHLPSPRYSSLAAADGKVFYAWAGLLAFKADPNEYTPLFEAKFGPGALLGTEAIHRRVLGLDALAAEQGAAQAQKIYDQKVGRIAPAICTSPAIANGRIYIRLNNAVACYDLRRSAALAEK